MTYSLYRDTRSVRLTVTIPDGNTVTVENLVGDSGFSMSFEAKRTMDESPGEFAVTVYNLPPDALSALELAQVRRIDDVDRMLVDDILQTAGVATDGADALASGWPIVELEAGYDGIVTRVFKAIGAKVETDRTEGGTTDETVIRSAENLDGVLLGLPTSVFPAGAALFDVVDYLRRLAGLGPGNLSPATLAGIIGPAKLDSPYALSGGEAMAHLRNVLQYLPLRWFVDDREIWVCGRDGVPNPYGFPAYVPDGISEPDLLLTKPKRDSGGRVVIECLLCPRIRPGRLVRLTEAGLALALQGLSPTAQQIAYAKVPPGLYRCDEVTHVGSTSDMSTWTTTAILRPGVAKAGAA